TTDAPGSLFDTYRRLQLAGGRESRDGRPARARPVVRSVGPAGDRPGAGRPGGRIGPGRAARPGGRRSARDGRGGRQAGGQGVPPAAARGRGKRPVRRRPGYGNDSRQNGPLPSRSLHIARGAEFAFSVETRLERPTRRRVTSPPISLLWTASGGRPARGRVCRASRRSRG